MTEVMKMITALEFNKGWFYAGTKEGTAMSLKRESKTTWEMVTVCGERNEYETISATKEGLEIGYCGTIPWSEIGEARALVTGEREGLVWEPIVTISPESEAEKEKAAEKKVGRFLRFMLIHPRYDEAMKSGWTREDIDKIQEKVNNEIT